MYSYIYDYNKIKHTSSLEKFYNKLTDKYK